MREDFPCSVESVNEHCFASFQPLLLLSLVAAFILCALCSVGLCFALTFRNTEYRISVPI